jgi:putative membrane protein
VTEPPSGEPDRRWPRHVYGAGTEPDPRFTLANERTFLAWIRTALGFLAGGVGVMAIAGIGGPVHLEVRIAAIALIACGLACGVGGLTRWIRNERALRLKRPLPSSPLLTLIAVGIAVVAVVAVVVVLQ